MTTNPYQQYKEAALSTMSPGEILVKLFDESLVQLRHSKLLIEQKEFYKANESLTKVETILGTLNDSLDMRFEVSQQLRHLYVFMAQQVLQANLRKDAGLIDDVVGLIRDLRDSFEQADRLNRQSHRVPAGGRAL